MCRRDQILGVALLSFGIGLLVACWIESLFWQICFGVCFTCGGFLMLQKK